MPSRRISTVERFELVALKKSHESIYFLPPAIQGLMIKIRTPSLQTKFTTSRPRYERTRVIERIE